MQDAPKKIWITHLLQQQLPKGQHKHKLCFSESIKSYLKSVYRIITSRKNRPRRRMLKSRVVKREGSLERGLKKLSQIGEKWVISCSLRAAHSWTSSLGMTEVYTNLFEDSSTRPKPHCGRLPQCATLISTSIFYSKWTLALLQNSQKWLSISLSIKGRANTQPVLCILAFLHYLWGTLHALMIDIEDVNHMVSSLSVAANLSRMNKSMWSSCSILIMSG